MNDIREGVRAYLEQESGIHAVCAPARHTGEYPLLAVEVQEEGTVLCAGGRQAEHRYRVTVTCAGDRERSDKNAKLAALVPMLLRGVPVSLPSGMPDGGKVRRVLSPQGIETEDDAVRFALCLTRPVPPKEDVRGDSGEVMGTLHWSENNLNM